MKSFQNTSRLFRAGGAVLIIALAACVTPTSASHAATAPSPETPTVCDTAFCGAADDLDVGVSATAAASLPDSPITAPSSGFSAAAMAALGVAMMTGRIRRKALWGVRAPWRPLAAHSS